ncbi:MAG: FAD binding domain-containing protein [Egibacteraceae bacterium]
MKPPPFGYAAPTTVDEALDALAQAGSGGKVLAGGQSLIPLLNMRLAAPSTLVDINRVDELATITVDEDTVRVGATVRHAALEHHKDAERACPLLRQALELVAHPVIRNRGTVCGSIAHADPAGELTTVLAVLDGRVEIVRLDGDRQDERSLASDDFFVGPLESVLEAGDLVTAVTFPTMPPGSGSAFRELARRHGDYAMCGVAAVVTVEEDGTIKDARAGYLAVAATPLVVDLTETLGGSPVEEADWTAAAEQGAQATDPEGDLHATADYRRHLARVLGARALSDAAEHAKTRTTA